MKRRPSHDHDLELYRTLVQPPEQFRDGFSLTTIAGILFCGLIMLPGSIYLGLMTGGNLGAASQWVTVILFMELARRALHPLSRQQLVVLLHAAGVMMTAQMLFPGGPMGQLVYRAYLVSSEAARDAGMALSFPTWFVPPPGSPALLERTLLHRDWLVPILILVFMLVIGFIQRYTLGYVFFRLTSDVEQLPFPTAPIAAQGTLALTEAEESQAPAKDAPETDTEAPRERKGLSWRIFSLGAVLGLAFGFAQVGIPAISSLFLAKPLFLIPQPFVDTTVLTQGLLPATPTGITFDLGIVFIGFVLPFWAVIGSFLAVVITAIVNPTLQHFGVLHHWQPGMDTVNTTFSNSLDFWMSFNIGAGLGIAGVCLFATGRDVWLKLRAARQRRGERAARNIWQPPREGRGDYSMAWCLVLYGLTAVAVIILCWKLLPATPGLLFFLVFFSFIYSPFISYVNARLLGISGQNVDIPFVKEASFIFSGTRGLGIWLAPVPVENYGFMAQAFRVNELTGVKFWSLIKTELIALPLLVLLSLTFWGFIWRSDAIPSDLFPAAQVNWELAAKNQVLLFSSTFEPPGQVGESSGVRESEFIKALHPRVITGACVGTAVLYALLSFFGLPVMLIYGLIRGLGQLPHFLVLEFAGALLGRYFFQRRFGQVNFLRMAPALLAGYLTGVGLVSMITMALMLIKSAVTSVPF